MTQLFAPYGDTKVIAVGTASESKSIALESPGRTGSFAVRVYNNTAVTVYVEMGAGSATAVVPGVASAGGPGGIAVNTKAELFLEAGPKITHVAAISTASTAGGVFVTPGVVYR